MKFSQFLNETPYIAKDIDNVPTFPNRIYTRKKKQSPTKEWEWKGYTVEEYKGQFGTTDTFLIKDDNVELYVSYSVEKFTNLGNMYKNSYIQKGEGSSFTKDMIIEFTFFMIKEKHADGIISDDIQSTGGKKMWRNILEHGIKLNKEIGVYDNQKHEVQPKDEDKKFALWYAIKSREVYSDTDLLKANYQLYVKF